MILGRPSDKPRTMAAARTLIVGDVHGCADELDDLLRVAGFAAGDRLVLVGDLVAKGPDSAGVVARARELGALAVRGNHEMPVLAYLQATRAGREPPAMKPTHAEAARALSSPDALYLEALPFFLEFPELDTLVVHAGLLPGVPLLRQRPDDLINMRSIRDDGSPSKRGDDGVPWASRWPGPTHVVFGHDAVRKLQRHAHATGLDTGCVYGGELTALELPSGRIHAVRARRQWCPT